MNIIECICTYVNLIGPIILTYYAIMSSGASPNFVSNAKQIRMNWLTFVSPEKKSKLTNSLEFA